jgi:hypothetical protein
MSFRTPIKCYACSTGYLKVEVEPGPYLSDYQLYETQIRDLSDSHTELTFTCNKCDQEFSFFTMFIRDEEKMERLGWEDHDIMRINGKKFILENHTIGDEIDT